ncbi:hypothetical protein [Rhizobium mongolense]|uniref:Uncharacterized protein n=2 Tax=Rhizobium mongolense TaxID=57676 RepID=A0ABR6IUL1_9HYPH|nr:hypothetical protein [Rhizobium mongolense]MBB4231597.1 hypothetical protein [Rhizobium mongolense]TVZ64176.1 hypothetical protein BCL32_4392 [Rhizobium mongolense USDA 1844]
MRNFDFTGMRTSDTVRRTALAFGLMLIAAGPISCAAVDDDLALASNAKPAKTVVTNVPRSSKIYSYAVASTKAAAPVSAGSKVYYGSAPWICTPSGFGQKSRCFARPAT